MHTNATIQLGDYYYKFIETKVSEGSFKNASEVVTAALKLFEEEERKIQELKIAIQEGIDSGFVENYNPIEHLKSLKQKALAKNG